METHCHLSGSVAGGSDELRGKIGCLTIWRVCPDSVKLLSCANSSAKLKLLYNFQLTSVNYFESNLKFTFSRDAETSMFVDITMLIFKNINEISNFSGSLKGVINITIEIMCRRCRV